MRIIMIDMGYYIHSSVYSALRSKMNPRYTMFSMVLGDLKKLNVNKDDLVIIGIDSEKGSWRRKIYKDYKRSRGEKRKREKIEKGIDWKKEYDKFDDFIEQLKKATPFYYLKADYLEADDLISSSAEFFQDKELIVLSIDHDYKMLFIYPNLKIFSPRTKKFISYENPHLVLEKKIKYGKSSEDLHELENDYEKKKIVCNLMSLPENIKHKVDNLLHNLEEKEYNPELIPYPSLRKRFYSLYQSSKKEKNLEKNSQTKLID